MQLQVKAPWRDGITHQITTPLEFMQRLTALVARPRLHLIRLHDVLIPNAQPRAVVVPPACSAYSITVAILTLRKPAARRRQLMAGTTHSKSAPTATVGPPGDCTEGSLSGSVSNSRSRPSAVVLGRPLTCRPMTSLQSMPQQT